MQTMQTEDIRTVLVGVAEPAQRVQPAVERAAAIAKSVDAELILFHSAFEAYLSGRPFFDSVRLAKSRGDFVHARGLELEKIAAQLRRQGVAAATRVVWQEPAYAALIQAAIREDADLVIVGAHRSRAGRGPVLRQNDWELMRHCARPLLIVRGRKESGPVVAALDPQHANDKPAALDVVLAKSGAGLAAVLEADFHVAHCVSDSVFPLGVITAKDRQRMSRVAQEKLRAVLRKAKVAARKAHVLHGLVENTLPELLVRLDARVLVLGALSRRGIDRYVFGNTAERLIHETDCDLLVVKPPEFKVRLPRAKKQAIVLPNGAKLA